MRQNLVIALMIVLVMAGSAVANLTPSKAGLVPFEFRPEEILVSEDLSEEQKALYHDVNQAYLDNRYLDGMDLLVKASITHPEIRGQYEYQLFKAELYFMLGVAYKKIQFEITKPIFTSLFYCFPKSPHEPLVLFRLATILKRQKFFPEAEGMYSVLIQRYPDSEYAHDARLGLAYCQYSQGHYADAVALIQTIKTDSLSTPYTPFVLAIEAKIAFKMRDVWRSLDLFEQAFKAGLAVNDLAPEGLFFYAETLFENARRDQGYMLHKRLVLRSDAGEYMAGALLRMADYEISIGKRREALKRYNTLIQNYLESEPGYLAAIRLGDLRARSYPDALDSQVIDAYLTVAGSLAPIPIANVAKQRLSSYYLAGGDYLRSVHITSDLLRSKPSTQIQKLAFENIRAAFRKYVDRCLSKRRNMDICRTYDLYHIDILNSHPDRELTRKIFQAHAELLMYDTVLRIANESFIKTERTAMARLFAGKALLAKGEIRKGAKMLVWVANAISQPEKSEALLELAKIRFKNGDINGTISMLERVANTPSLPPDVYTTACIELARRKVEVADLDQGHKWFVRALDILDPPNNIGTPELLSDAIFGLADVSYRTGDMAKAKMLYRSAVGGFEGDVRIPVALLRLKEIAYKAKSDPDWFDAPLNDTYWKWITQKVEDQKTWTRSRENNKG